MKRYLRIFRVVPFILTLLTIPLYAQQSIQIAPDGVNDVLVIKNAIEQAKTYSGQDVTIKLGGGTYHLHRNQATPLKYYISNTMSWNSGTANIKNIGILLKDAKRITIEGEGAKFITHGEITSIVIDNCEDIVLKNFSIDATDPSVTEMTVESISGNNVIYKVHPTSNYQISGTTLKWTGEYGWSFTGGPVQLYDPVQDITWRSGAPTDGLLSINDLGSKRININYSSTPSVKVGWTYQMRDGVRDQVTGFILKSKNIVYDHVNLNFLGNFGVVCQYSENLSFINCRFAPEINTGRTNAGFADFLQVSGCKGLLKVEDSYFSGAHDDPINVHGTYLKIQNYLSPTQVKVKFMHHESWGFEAFFVNDSIEFIDVATMQKIDAAKVISVQRNDDQNITLSFDKAIDVAAFSLKSSGVVIENITWTPEVEIRQNYFSRIPTRGILLTTRRRSVIEDNTFFRMQMAGIYVSGDAASWYESGKVADLTIRNNKFIECGAPAIYFDPTNSQNNGYVHSNIKIENNTFTIKSGLAVGGKSVNKLSFTNNTIIHSGTGTVDSYVSLSNSGSITKTGNIKLQPGAIPLSGLNSFASSSESPNDKSLANDGINSSSWKPLTTDTDKWWAVDLGTTYSINRIQLLFPQSAAWKYRIEVSTDNSNWIKAIDQSDNSISNSTFTSAGNLGQNIRYIRISFGNSNAALGEMNVFGDKTLPEKINLLSGTVIGTNGSWDNNLSVTKEYVFDFNPNTYFDAPSGSAWVGLDLGLNASFKIDSIRFVPRTNHLYRMPNGTFEISNSPLFTTKTTLYTVVTTPPDGYSLVTNFNPHEAGRYIRYVSPFDGFGNINEIEFYGYNTKTGIQNKKINDNDIRVFTDKNSKKIHISFFKETNNPYVISIYSPSGNLVAQENSFEKSTSISYKNLLKGIYLILISNHNDLNYRSKLVL